MKQSILIWSVAGAVTASFGFGVYQLARRGRLSDSNAAAGVDAPGGADSLLTAVGSGSTAPAAIACGGAPNGTKCGKGDNNGMLCVFDLCTKNVCGDALTLQGEDCDDGNTTSGDGCNAKCQWEALPKCGNGQIDPGEQCDDGNRVDGDPCTTRCTAARCGDGSQGPGEECDDGNLDDTDECAATCTIPDPNVVAGSVGARLNADGSVSLGRAAAGRAAVGADARGTGTSALGSAAAAGAGGASVAHGAGNDTTSLAAKQRAANSAAAAEGCKACTERECRNFNAIDLVKGCYEAVNDQWGAAPDASFLQACAELVSCSHANECWTDSFKLGAGCYCGNIALDDCLRDGPSQDAPCVAEFVAAARSTNHQEIMQRMSDFAFPAAWAYFYLECEAKNCRKACVEAGV